MDTTKVTHDAHAHLRIHHTHASLEMAVDECSTLREVARLTFLNQERFNRWPELHSKVVEKEQALRADNDARYAELERGRMARVQELVHEAYYAR